MYIWSIYSLIAIFIIAYPIFVKPSGNTMRYMWISYILLGALIGIYQYNNNKKDHN